MSGPTNTAPSAWCHQLVRKLAASVFLSALAGAASAAPDFGKCEVTGPRGTVKLQTVVPGTLSVRPVLPSPGWWNGDSLETVKDGYEYCFAAHIANRAGLDRVVLVSRSFPQILTGQAKGFDLAISQITITEERKKIVNFTDPYFESDQGVLVKAGTKVNKESMKKLRLGVLQGSTAYHFITNEIKPENQPRVYNETASMYAALGAGQIDGVMYDTPNLLARAKQSNGMLEVGGRYATGEKWGALVNKDSPNLAAFNQIIAELKKDGTFDRLASKYLTESLGMDPSKLPVLTP